MQKKSGVVLTNKERVLLLMLVAGMIAGGVSVNHTVGSLEKINQSVIDTNMVSDSVKKQKARMNRLTLLGMMGAVACGAGAIGILCKKDLKEAQRDLDAVREKMNQRSK